MNADDIDVTHVIVLQENDGLFRTEEVPISRPEQLITELQAMINNPGRTVWDMESIFERSFPERDSFFDYIHPHQYFSSFVSGIGYPDLVEYAELKSSWEEAGRAARTAYIEVCRKNNTIPKDSVANQEEIKAIERLKELQKSIFLKNAVRWINASCYMEALDKLESDRTVKMYSKENIGWNTFSYRINEDIEITLKTNFGYGSAAYFLIAIRYKDIDILPYSYIVKYYKANMADIVRCTRSYRPCRESWSVSFDFISDFVNNSMVNPHDYVHNYIMREVIEMMQGLEAINKNSKGYISRISSFKPDPCVINVYSMSGDDRTRMQSYPDEVPVLFKIEKITGALDFLNNLKAIVKEVEEVQAHIDRLIEINLALYPEIEVAIAKIKEKIEAQEVIKNNLNTQISVLLDKLAPFEEEISRLKDDATSETPFSLWQYGVSHPEYVALKNQNNDLRSQLYKVKCRIYDFTSFLEMLNDSISKLDELKQSK